MQVTACELKLRLRHYLAAVRTGEVVSVTRRGKLVAELRAAEPLEHELLARLAAAGRVTLGREGPWPPRVPRRAERSATHIILEGRDERHPFPSTLKKRGRSSAQP